MIQRQKPKRGRVDTRRQHMTQEKPCPEGGEDAYNTVNTLVLILKSFSNIRLSCWFRHSPMATGKESVYATIPKNCLVSCSFPDFKTKLTWNTHWKATTFSKLSQIICFGHSLRKAEAKSTNSLTSCGRNTVYQAPKRTTLSRGTLSQSHNKSRGMIPVNRSFSMTILFIAE